MSNPFTGKSLKELRDGVPSYSDVDLNALAAEYCEGWRFHHDSPFSHWHDATMVVWADPPSYTTDLREAGRLLEGKVYVIKSGPEGFCGPWVYFGWIQHPADASYRWTEEYGGTENLCRAITEAAVVAGLTQMIEGAANAGDRAQREAAL